ncbi:MAG: hydrolase TatD [Betaproteobacteria bacterium]|nr:hydrolase TatD [Betaproteobacteria bacterium]
MTCLIDIGANLAHESFHHDLEDVLARARDNRVATMIVTGTSLAASRAAVELAEGKAPQLYATVGVHPHDSSTFDDTTVEEMRALSRHPCVKALGECGLDYNRNYSPGPNQLAAFEAQLKLATEVRLPLFLHDREADHDMRPLIARYRDGIVDAVIHCFTGSREALHAYLDLDLHIGVTGWICDERRGLELQRLVRDVPANRLMLETDSPYLMPRTIRPMPKHRRNEPAHLPHVARMVAECTGRSVDTVMQETTETARRFFRL